MSFLIGVLANVVANLVFWVGLGGVFWIAGRIGQARFARFFGVGGTSRMVVVLSNVWDPATSSRPVGYSISKHESLAAQSIAVLLGTAPTRLPELARGLVDAI